MIFLRIALTCMIVSIICYLPLRWGLFHSEEDPEKNWIGESMLAVACAFLGIVAVITLILGIWLA